MDMKLIINFISQEAFIMNNQNKKPVVLITGYLGSGKTTLMQKLLAQESRKIALIVNDMGSINIERRLSAKAAN